MHEDDDKVRFRRPPRETRFQSGRSGNPRGRPKGSLSVSAHVRAFLNATVRLRENGKERTVTRAEAVALQLVNLAAKGDPKGLAAVMNATRELEAIQKGVDWLSPAGAENAEVLSGLINRLRSAGLEMSLAAGNEAEDIAAPGGRPSPSDDAL